MKVSICSLGCKVNTVESASIAHMIKQNGHEVTMKLESADAFIINTCTVTGEADRKSRQMIRRCVKLNPYGQIYIIGCSSQNASNGYSDFENVVYIGGNADKANVVKLIDQCSDELTYGNMELPSVFEEMAIPEFETTRNFIKIQDGCNNFCSYCMIPYVRGRERSRNLKSIVDEAKACAKISREIVLTGINVSSYGSELQSSLPQLINALAGINIRKRLSSFECNIVDKELLDAMVNAGFCDSFHLSLQSGCNNVLKGMNRHYSTQLYKEKVDLIRSYFPNAGITTDLITGFPNESEEDFEETKLFIQSVGFSDIHIFPYSERVGTRASRERQLPMELRKYRAKELEKIRKEMSDIFLEKQIGKKLSVYFEENGKGYSTNYVKVYADELKGVVKDITITKLYKEGVM